MNERFLNELSARLAELASANPAKDLEKNFRGMLSSAFTRMELVSREEYDVQAQVLARAREKLAALEARVAELEARAAAKAAQAHDFISSFPEGYNARIGERGATLSGGQKQRIAIARALLLNPRILILDDSTSSVDLATEAALQKALDVLMKGRTSFVIAQRISTVINADKIIVLDQGKIAAEGRHKELMEDSPIYAEIYNSQILVNEHENK